MRLTPAAIWPARSTWCSPATVAGALAAPQPAAEAQTPKKGGVLRVAERADPVGFDTLGQKKAAVYTQLALTFTHSRLFRYTPAGEVVPNVAGKWGAAKFPTTYVDHTQEGRGLPQQAPRQRA